MLTDEDIPCCPFENECNIWDCDDSKPYKERPYYEELKLYKIVGITDLVGQDKTDEASQRRLRSTYKILQIIPNFPMVLEYVTDNKGKSKRGYLKTSIIQTTDYSDSDDQYIVMTSHSIYFLKGVNSN
jgi:hypothetical protein